MRRTSSRTSRAGRRRWSTRSAISTVSARRAPSRRPHPARLPHALPRRLRRRPPRAPRPRRRHDLPRCGRAGRVRVRAARRRRRGGARARGAARGAGNARALARIDLDPRARPDEHRAGPRAVLTGDTLFIGDVGRPDLRASLGWSAEELGAMLYDSLHEKLLTLPDDVLVYPAHGAGSLCGKNLSTDTVSTIGVQRRYNYALQPMSREEFVRLVTAEQPDTPAYFSYDAVLNTKERPTLDEALEEELRPLALEQALALREGG